MLNGQNITKVSLFNSSYGRGHLEVKDDQGNWYKLPVETVEQMVSEFYFKTEEKRKYTHLVEAIPYQEIEEN